MEEILGLAVRSDEPAALAVPDERGLTLSELQEIGVEVGVRPRRMAEAALAFETSRQNVSRRTTLGMPTTVGRNADLPRALTDHEWDILVGELRETFGARGTVAMHGSGREWTNGNLHVFLEPTTTGHRLRMGTHKSDATPLTMLGATGLALGLALLVLFLGEGLPAAAMVAALIALAGGGVLGTNMLRLPRWAREREAQMEYIGSRVQALLAESEEAEPRT
ncbi:MAG: hypothetical protein MJB57_09400 [Gemmatimonadetes bacterium]|nr:hypothetical protein [Gemmatimonadota bacterium]